MTFDQDVFINEDQVLRPISQIIPEVLLSLVDQNRSHLRQHLGWVDKTTTQDHMVSFIQLQSEAMQNKECLTYGIIKNNTLAGLITLRELTSEKPSIGYWISEEAQGQGLVTSSCRKLISVVSQELSITKVVLYAGTTNPRSIEVAKRLGFTFIGVKKNHEKVRGSMVDAQHFSLNIAEMK